MNTLQMPQGKTSLYSSQSAGALSVQFAKNSEGAQIIDDYSEM